MPKSDPIFATERFSLRLFQESDIDDLYSLYSDSEVMRFLPGDRTRDVAEKHVTAFAEQYDESGFTLWAVESRSTGEFVGRVGLWPLDHTDEVELGCVIARPHRGNGIATETSIACLHYGFERLKLPFVAAIAVADNQASIRVLQKLGFKFVREDQYYDMNVLYHRLEREPTTEG